MSSVSSSPAMPIHWDASGELAVRFAQVLPNYSLRLRLIGAFHTVSGPPPAAPPPPPATPLAATELDSTDDESDSWCSGCRKRSCWGSEASSSPYCGLCMSAVREMRRYSYQQGTSDVIEIAREQGKFTDMIQEYKDEVWHGGKTSRRRSAFDFFGSWLDRHQPADGPIEKKARRG